jgi:hypothetical protein
MSGAPGGQRVSEDHSTLKGQPEGSETRYTIGLKGSVDDRWAEAFRLTQAQSPVFLRFRLDRASSSIGFSCRTVDGAVLVFDVLERLEALLKAVNQRAGTWRAPDMVSEAYRALGGLTR